MNNIETMIVTDNEKEITLYILSEIIYNNQKYIFYIKKLKNILSKEDIYVGKITQNNELIKIEEELMDYFNNILENIINNLKKNK